MKAVQTLELLKDYVQEAIDKGATSVQQIHEYIADLPFEAADKAGLLELDKLDLRARQKRTIGMVYDAIRRINRQVGDLISDQFENLEDAESAAHNIRAKPAAAARPAAKQAAPMKAAKKPAAKKTAKKAAKKAAEPPPAAAPDFEASEMDI